MDSLQEYIGLANELRTQFAAGDDAASVASVVAARAQLDAAVAAREGGAASAIEREFLHERETKGACLRCACGRGCVRLTG